MSYFILLLFKLQLILPKSWATECNFKWGGQRDENISLTNVARYGWMTKKILVSRNSYAFKNRYYNQDLGSRLS